MSGEMTPDELRESLLSILSMHCGDQWGAGKRLHALDAHCREGRLPEAWTPPGVSACADAQRIADLQSQLQALHAEPLGQKIQEQAAEIVALQAERAELEGELAEAKKRLGEVKTLSGGKVDAVDTIKDLTAENARLRKIEEAARTHQEHLADSVARLLAKQRTGGSVYMDGKHNPSPSEKQIARKFANNRLSEALKESTTEGKS